MVSFLILLLFAILDITKSTSCQPGRVYCAYQLRLTYNVWDAHRIRIKCGDDGQIKDVFQACYYNCTHRGDGGDAFCQCRVGVKHCGHQLQQLGMNGYEDNSIYACIDGGLNVSLVEECTNGCIVHDLSAICAGSCVPGGYYCGNQLTTMKWDGYDNNTIYQCAEDGYSVNNVTVCSEGCIQTDQPNAYCTCKPGRLYCLSHLYNTMNWREPSESNDFSSQTLVQCSQSGRDAEIAVICGETCIQRGHSNAFCKCIANLKYCGYVLNRMGWQQCSGNPDAVSDDYICTEYDNNTLYLCTDGGVNVVAIEACAGECIGGMTGRSSCHEPCQEGKFYCGYFLRSKGLKGYDDKAIYECDGSGQLRIVTSCSDGGCLQFTRTAKCACVPGRYYCGHQLQSKLGWWRLGDYKHGLFECTKYGEGVAMRAYCSTCLAQMDMDSFCPCTPGTVYCGRLLSKMGMKNCSGGTMPFHGQCREYTNDTSYKCVNDGRHVAQLLPKHEDCKNCTPGRTYCGHQLRQWRSVPPVALNRLFICRSDNDTLDNIAQCTKCIKGEPNSHCMCIPRSRYCGHWLIKNGYLSYDNDTIYSCSDDGTPGAAIETCFPGECRQGNHYGHCPCTPGKLYCGHELYEHYNEPHTFLTTNAIYECSSDRKRVNSKVTCTNSCISSPARCKKPCVRNQHYCGSDLMQQEGWEDEGLLQDSLYQCFNETTATQVQNCTAGCQTISGGGATCKGTTTF